MGKRRRIGRVSGTDARAGAAGTEFGGLPAWAVPRRPGAEERGQRPGRGEEARDGGRKVAAGGKKQEGDGLAVALWGKKRARGAECAEVVRTSAAGPRGGRTSPPTVCALVAAGDDEMSGSLGPPRAASPPALGSPRGRGGQRGKFASERPLCCVGRGVGSRRPRASQGPADRLPRSESAAGRTLRSGTGAETGPGPVAREPARMRQRGRVAVGPAGPGTGTE